MKGVKRDAFKRIWQQTQAPRKAIRSRGFGVHSPFAFRFIREVLRQPYAYYSYQAIERSCRLDGTDPRVAKALYRLALFFRNGGFSVVGPINDTMRQAISAGIQSRVAAEPPECHAGIGNGKGRIEEMWYRAESGMLFASPELTVYVVSPHLSHQRFNILLP